MINQKLPSVGVFNLIVVTGFRASGVMQVPAKCAEHIIAAGFPHRKCYKTSYLCCDYGKPPRYFVGRIAIE